MKRAAALLSTGSKSSRVDLHVPVPNDLNTVPAICPTEIRDFLQVRGRQTMACVLVGSSYKPIYVVLSL